MEKNQLLKSYKNKKILVTGSTGFKDLGSVFGYIT